MNHSSQFGLPYMKKDKSDNLSIIFILFQSGGLRDRDKLLMSCQAFIFPNHESLCKHKLLFYVAMAVFGECTQNVLPSCTQEN